MTNQPLVSVLMTSYNREKYIAEAIESVITSTYQNWELIIVDDHSKDNTVEIARKYEQQDKRIHVYINEKNLGDYPNRNKAASYAKGKYLKYLDSDDIIYPHCISLMVETMTKFPEAGIALSMVEQENTKPYPFQLTSHEAFLRHYLIKPVFNKSPLGSIISKEAFNSIGGFTGKQHVGDFEFWHLLAAHKPIVLMTGGLAWYRSHDSQQMNDNRTNSMVPFKYFLITLEQLQNKLCPLNTLEKEQILIQVSNRISRYILSRLRKGEFKKSNEMKKKIGWSWYRVILSSLNNSITFIK